MNDRAASCLLILGACLCLRAETAAAQRAPVEVQIQTTRSAFRKTAVMVRGLSARSGGPAAASAADLATSVLANDLLLSGLCTVARSGAGADSAGVEFVIEGTVEGPLLGSERTGEDAPLTVSLDLLTHPGRQLLLNKRYRPDSRQVRATAHHFADEVLAMITGEPGICLTRVVFSRGQGDRRDLYAVDYDGEGLLRLTSNRTLNLCPSWSPDNAQIAFTSYHEGQQGLFCLDAGTGRVRRIIAEQGLNLGADWHPDGKELLVSLSWAGNPEIYRVSAQGEIRKRLTVSPAIEVSPSWSPGGRSLVFTSDKSGSPQLYIIDADGSGSRRLTYEGKYNDSAAWSPRGDRIAYAAREGNRTRIVVMKPTGEDRRVVTGPEWGNSEDPSWAPDGRHVVFASDRTGVFKLYVYDVVEEGFRQLTFGPDPDITPAWSH